MDPAGHGPDLPGSGAEAFAVRRSTRLLWEVLRFRQGRGGREENLKLL